MTRRGMLVVTLVPMLAVLAAVGLGWLRGAEDVAELAVPLVAGVVVFFGSSWLLDRLLGGGDV
jgi:type IV secretory pathway VirB2 component (pilin)